LTTLRILVKPTIKYQFQGRSKYSEKHSLEYLHFCEIFSNPSSAFSILSSICFLYSDELIGNSISLPECSHLRLSARQRITLLYYTREVSLLILISKPAAIYTAWSVQWQCPNLVFPFDTLYACMNLPCSESL
jgi:hypothetical protein